MDYPGDRITEAPLYSLLIDLNNITLIYKEEIKWAEQLTRMVQWWMVWDFGLEIPGDLMFFKNVTSPWAVLVLIINNPYLNYFYKTTKTTIDDNNSLRDLCVKCVKAIFQLLLKPFKRPLFTLLRHLKVSQ